MRCRNFPLAHLVIAMLALSPSAFATDGTGTSAPIATAARDDVVDRLRAVPGLSVVAELPSRIPGLRAFHVELDQPADHQRPEAARFHQRAVLLHRGFDLPLVLATNGYGLGLSVSQHEPTQLLQSNQLAIEHRFFGPSRPQPANWEHLTIQQAAADHHRFVQALKPLYPGRWLSTGQSKGGMTAVYHRYFYPEDVDATVAYWAPSSHGVADVRYTRFLESEVGDADCRQRLFTHQREVLLRRDRFLPRMDELTAQTGATFELLGKERAFEFAAVEMPFYFWQEWGDIFCQYIPGPEDSDEQVWGWFLTFSTLETSFSDALLSSVMPYYHQAATQLGAPRYPEGHVRDLLRFPRGDRPERFVTFPVPGPFDTDAMLRVEHWVRNQGQRIMFVYGANDPWGATAFEVREHNDSVRYFVPRAGHATAIRALPEPQRSEAQAKVRAWAGVASPVIAAGHAVEEDSRPVSLEQHLRP